MVVPWQDPLNCERLEVSYTVAPFVEVGPNRVVEFFLCDVPTVFLDSVTESSPSLPNVHKVLTFST